MIKPPAAHQIAVLDQDGLDSSSPNPFDLIDGSDDGYNGSSATTPSFSGASPWTLGAPMAAATYAASSASEAAGSSPQGGSSSTTISTPGSGLVFVDTFSTGADDNFITCAENAEKELQAHFITPITINVSFAEADLGYSAMGTYTGAENGPTGGVVNVSYAKLSAALKAHQYSPFPISLPSTDPNSSAGDDWTLPETYARMLGLSSSTPSTDVTVTLNDDDKIGWSFGDDVTSVLLHEFTENGMGRIGGFGDSYDAQQNTIWSTMDLFTYSSAGVHNYQDGRDGETTSFSYDGTHLTSSVGLTFNQDFNSSGARINSGDTADWSEQGDPFGVAYPGDNYTMSATDIEIMDALGWTPVQQDYWASASGTWTTAADWEYWYGPKGYLPNNQDAWIGAESALVTSNSAETVNSIGVSVVGIVVIADDSRFTATNGTIPNADDVGNVSTGVEGAISVDVGSTLEIGNTFSVPGSLTIGVVLSSNGGNGLLQLDGTVTVKGGGTIYLGQQSNAFRVDSTGVIAGGSLANIDDTIIGGGTLSLSTLDNQSKGKIVADQGEGDDLTLDISSTFTNEGQLDAGDRATLSLGGYKATRSLTNTGYIFLGDDGSSQNLEDGSLAISGNYAVNGNGAIAFKGAGAAVISDGAEQDTFTNNSTIVAYASGQIGDGGIYGGVEDLTFDNSGKVYAYGKGVTLTLNTGSSNNISDGGGLLEGDDDATLIIDSPTTTGVEYLLALGHPAPSGGTIEATAGGIVDIAAAVTAGVSPTFPLRLAPGQVLVDSGSNVVVQSGGWIQIPININGTSGGTSGGTLTLQSGGGVTGTINFATPGGTFDDTSSGSFTFSFSGGGGTIKFSSKGDTADISGTGGSWDSIFGSNETIAETSALANVTGGSNTIDFAGGTGDQVSLYSTSGNWDTVNGSGGMAAMTSAQASIVGGSNTISANAGSTMSLYSTAGNFDTVEGSNVKVIFETAQASVVGGGDAIFTVGASTASLYSTTGKFDTVNGSDAKVILETAQASVVGGGDAIFTVGASTASLYSTAGDYDTVYGSSAKVIIETAQASVVGGGDAIFTVGASSASLYSTGGDWDTVHGSGASVVLETAQASILGGGDVITTVGASSASLYNTGGDWDTVNGSGAEVVLNSAQASIVGGGDTLFASAGSTLSLYGTGAQADAVSGSSLAMTLNGAQTSLTGAGDTTYFNGTSALKVNGASEAFDFAKALGLATITGFVSSDVIHLSAQDWTSFAALSSSGDLENFNGNATIKLDVNDIITLVGVSASSLHASQFVFA